MIELLPLTLFVFYLVPFLIAAARNHDAMMLFLVLNMIFGWTGVGWLALLGLAIWAPSANARVVPYGGPRRSRALRVVSSR